MTTPAALPGNTASAPLLGGERSTAHLPSIVQLRLGELVAAAGTFGPFLTGQDDVSKLPALRAEYVRTLARNLPPDGVGISEVSMGGLPAVLVVPDGIETQRVLIYMHGGGYMAGGPGAYHSIGGHFAKLLRAKVYMPAYRLAPEHPFPIPIDDNLAAYRWLLDQGHEADSIALSGDSAGGAMVISVMVKARDGGLPLPAAGVALSPWANLEHTGSSMSSREGIDPQCNRVGLDLVAKNFLGNSAANDPDASPVFADVRGLPPILVQIGESEVLLSDAIRLATHLAENRVRTSLEVWPGMFHHWHLFAADLPEARQALRNAADFLDQAFQNLTTSRPS